MGSWWRAPFHLELLLAVVLVGVVNRSDGGVTSGFVRKVEKTIDMPLDSDVFRVPPGYNAPQQVHITQGDLDGTAMIISWVTEDEPGSSEVLYGTDEDKLELSAEGKYTRYKFYNYTSGYIHHCTIRHLKDETVPFKPYRHRYHVPYRSSSSSSPFWYSIKRASAYIIVLASYSAYGTAMLCFT
ncbi:hypothetical protein B296_00042158 [Ensete ventricosum]|uniref:Purple acid phosphatase N-terminal domain-containing protein n=1 Tax=Ensete ventricosum TaxID=4639 RepID=A0A426X795_ENSVE|nr:hypothetical protein B296_00042158 [Ensete ventricosum]